MTKLKLSLELELQRKRLKEAEANLKVSVKTAQLGCKHSELVEADYLPMEYSGSLPPVRMCCSCGMTEDGWGSGYQVLKGAAVATDRDSVYATRVGLSIRDHHKGPLIRREVTLAKLIECDGSLEAAGVKPKDYDYD